MYPDVYAAVGIHPHDATTLNLDALGRPEGLASNPRVVAIGEIGLDFYRDLSPHLAPVPHRGKRNEPAYVRYVLERVAQILNRPIEDIDTLTEQNTRTLFSIPGPAG